MAEPTGGKSFPLSVVIQAVDKITKPLRSITSSIAAAGGKISGLGSSLARIGDRSGLPVLAASIGRVGGAAKGVVSAGGQVLGIFTRLAATAGLSAGGISMLAQAYADATGAIGDTAERTGISRERLQELGYAAQMSGSSAETMQGALAKMNLTLGSVRGGSKELKQMFDGLRISLNNSNGTAKSTDEVFNSIVGQLSKIKDPALQAKAAVTIFGKSATELLPLIRSGTAGLDEMSAEARRLGVVLSESAVRDGEAFGDVLDNLKFSLKGVGNSIGAALTPMLIQLGTLLTETIVKYRPQIEAFAAAFAQNLPTYIDNVVGGFHDFYDALRPVGTSILWLTDNFGVVNTALGALAVVIGAVVIPPLVALGSAIIGVGVALLTTPIGWFMGAVALLAGGAFLIYKNWDGIATFFTDKFTAVRDAFKTYVIDGIANLWNQFNPVKLVSNSFDAIGEKFRSLDMGGIGSRISGFFNGNADGSEGGTVALPGGGAAAVAGTSSQAKVTVDFKNLPSGATVDTAASPGAQIATNQGYSMMGAMP